MQWSKENKRVEDMFNERQRGSLNMHGNHNSTMQCACERMPLGSNWGLKIVHLYIFDPLLYT